MIKKYTLELTYEELDILTTLLWYLSRDFGGLMDSPSLKHSLSHASRDDVDDLKDKLDDLTKKDD